MDVETLLRGGLEDITGNIHAPAGLTARVRRRSKARRVQRVSLATTAVAGISAGAVLVGLDIGNGQQQPASHLVVSTPPASSAQPSPSSVQPSPSATPGAPTDTDIVDGVLVGGLPPGWYAAGNVPPNTVAYANGTRTKHDLVVGDNGQGGAGQVLVYRNTDLQPQQAALELVKPASGEPTLEAGASPDKGFIDVPTGPSQTQQLVGYRRLSPTLFVIVHASGWDLPKIIDNIRQN